MIFSLQRLAREKRVEVLLRAFRHCYQRTGTGVLVLGGKGPEEPALRALVEELGIGKQVRLTGYIPRQTLGSFYSACDLFAFHSTFETFGVVLAQAMAYGKPVLTVRNTALPEVVGNGGVIVETGDWRELGDAMARLITDEPWRTRLGQAAGQRARTLFHWDRIVEQHEAILAQAAGNFGHAS
jgi:glycosyltransferase involved in cell wall biosynthesis